MDIKQLQTFLSVAKLLNFRAASEELNYSQSTVSDHIRNLEDELNVKLFERLGRKVFLNKNGEKLLIYAEKIVKDSEEIHMLFDDSDDMKGSINIGASESLCATWLPLLLREYRSLYPNVQLTLQMADCTQFPEFLDKNIIDIAFGFHDESTNIQIYQTDLFECSAVFIASPENSLVHMKKLSLHDLENQSFILVESQSGYSCELKKMLENENIPLNPIMEFNSLEAIKECVKNNLGISLLPSIVVSKEIQAGELINLPVKIENIPVNAKMIYHKNKWLSPALSALVKLVISRKEDIYHKLFI